MRTAVLSRRFNPQRTINPPAVKSWFRLAFHHFFSTSETLLIFANSIPLL